METMIVERSEGLVTVTLNRPQKKNAAVRQTWVELDSVLQEVAENPNDRALMITGAEGNFCSGADLTDSSGTRHANAPTVTMMRRISDCILRLHRLPKPTLAKVDGVAVGIGLSLAVGCDLVVASERARFSAIFAKRGLAVDGGSGWLLPRLIGLQRAKELAFFGDIIPAADAHTLGLVNRVVPVDELDKTAGEWAQRLVNSPTLALSLTKSMMNNAFSITLDQALEDEARSQHITFTTADTAEAMAAFVGKREPKFQGR